MKKYFVFIFALSFLLISYLPNFYEASIVDLLPPDRQMILGEHIYTYDYNVYLSKIRQGTEGRWSIVDKYDNHPDQKGVFLQMLYLLSGKVTAPFKLSPTLTFHLLRTIVSIIWIYTIIWLSIFFLKKPVYYTLGVVISLLTAGWPIFYRFENQWWVKSYMEWWQELDVVKRISFLPHDTINYIVISLLTILLSLFAKTQKNRYLFYICLILFVSLFIHPASAVVFFFSWMIFNFIKIIWTRQITKKNLIKMAIQTIFITIVILIPLFYIKLVTTNYPWKSLIDFDQVNRLGVNVRNYSLALGPIFITGVFGAFFVLLKKEERLLPIVTWFLAAFVGIFIFKLFPYQSELRFIQTANHIPLAILSVFFFATLLKQRSVAITVITVITIIIIILNGLIQSYFSLKGQIDFIHQRAVATLPLVPYPPQVMYPLKDFYNGLQWLETNSSGSSVVLSKYTAGNYIPAYSGNFVYLGHSGETPFFDARWQNVDRFFSGNLPQEEALRFLKKEKIDYVFYGPQEKENFIPIQSGSNFKFLIPVYQSPQVTIYKVKNTKL